MNRNMLMLLLVSGLILFFPHFPVSFAKDEVGRRLDKNSPDKSSPDKISKNEVNKTKNKTKSLGDYQLHLVCDPVLGQHNSENCRIIITQPNRLNEPKAPLKLTNPNSLSGADIFFNANTHKIDSLFSAEALDDKALDKRTNTLETQEQKYKISRDWLFRLKISDDTKQPDISILSIIVPNDTSN